MKLMFNFRVFITDDAESLMSYGSGSIRSGARSPKKKVKLWHPSQDGVSPFLHESTERNMRRRFNSTVSIDNSTQTPEKDKHQKLVSPEKDKQQKSASPQLPAADEMGIRFENLDTSASASPSQKHNEEKQDLNPNLSRNLNFDDLTSFNSNTTPNQHADVSQEKENTANKPDKSTSNQERDDQIILRSRKPKRIPSVDSISSIGSNDGDEREIIHNSMGSKQKNINDDHLFLKPSCSSQAGASNMSLRKWKLSKKTKGFRFFEVSPSPRLRRKDKSSVKSSNINNRSPWRRADQGAGEDISWPATSKDNRQVSPISSDEDFVDDPKKKSRKKMIKGSSTNSGTSCSSDNSPKRFYSREEEVKILDFIIEHNAFSQVKGISLWKIMEATQVLQGRSSQSMKERFRRHILPKLNNYKHLSKTDRQNFRNPPCQEYYSKGSKEKSQPTSPDVTNIEDEVWNEDDNASVASDGNQSIKSILNGSRQSRNFSIDEDMAILNFIVTNRRFSEVNGNNLWRLMESKSIAQNRSWQSLKERFRRQIGPNLGRYKTLKEKDISQLNKYLSAVSRQIKDKSK